MGTDRDHVIRRTSEELAARKVNIVNGLGMPYDAFAQLVAGGSPLSDAQWSAMQELREIDYLSGGAAVLSCDAATGVAPVE